MAKQGSIKHYRQTSAAKAPPSLPFGELAVAKDGTLFAGNEANVPVQAGMQMELLWENASPTSTFPAQTILLDLSSYTHVGIPAKWEKGINQSEDGIRIYRINSVIKNTNSSAPGAIVGAGRYFTLTSTGVHFRDGYSGGTLVNEMLIPLEIYGIRGINV